MSVRNSEVVQNKSYLKVWEPPALRECVTLHETRLARSNLTPDERESEERELARIKAELALRGVPIMTLARS